MKQPEKATLAALFIIGFLVRLYFNATTDAVTYGTDATARLMQARDWWQNPEGLPGSLIWLPLHHFLLLALVPFGLSFELSGRIVTLLLSSFSIPLFYLLVRSVFDTTIAAWSALLLAINPFHILYSSYYMTEDVFLFFVIAAVYLLKLHTDSGNKKHLYLSSIMVNSACWIRYEGWLIAGLLPFFFYFQQKEKNLKACLFYFLRNIPAILVYCFCSWTNYDIFIYGLYESDKEVRLELSARPDLWQHLTGRLSMDFIFPVWMYLLVIAGVVRAIVSKHNLPYLFIWLALFAVSAWKILTFSSQPFWRYLSCPLLMLIPYGAWFLARLSAKSNFYLCLAMVAVFGLSIMPIAGAYRSRQFMSEAPQAYKQGCRQLKEIRLPHEKVIFDVKIKGYDHAAFFEEADINSNMTWFPMPPSLSFLQSYQRISDSSLISIISDTGFHYVFIQEKLALDSVIHGTVVQQYLQSSGISLDALNSSSNFQLLRIRR